MKVYELLALLKTADPSDEVVIDCCQIDHLHRVTDARLRHKQVILVESIDLPIE